MKAGVLSLYYNNANYGGLLQSYAMTTALNKLGVQGEQICYNAKTTKNPLNGKDLSSKDKIRKYGLNYIFFSIGVKCKKKYRSYKLKCTVSKNEQKQLIEKRIQYLKMFEQSVIPHSTKIYDKDNIQECVDLYDIFVCGSDQVWNPSFIRDEYLLKFVPSGKKKISYAASISRDFLTEYQRKYISNALEDFDAISVREKTAISLLSVGHLEGRVVCMPDPTFLLTEDDWNQLIEREENAACDTEDYILCYFLSGNLKQRRIVKRIAQKNGLKTVGFPHVLSGRCYADIKYAYDQEEYECSPAKFIDLIKRAKYVMTDSFHATVFSIIFKREFIVFHREKTSYENGMLSRLTDLLEEIGLGTRVVGNNASEVAKVMSERCDFSATDKWLAENRERGVAFLKKAIS